MIGFFAPVTLFIALFVVWFVSLARSERNVESGVGVDRVEWLPQTASNISYYRSRSLRIWEATMEEADFREWAAGVDLSEIEEPRQITRFVWVDYVTSYGSEDGSYSDESQSDLVATIKNGLFWEVVWDNGGGYHVIYDRDGSRVYFDFSRQ